MFTKVLDFWFKEIESSKWWVKDLIFDNEIKQRFIDLHQAANKGELYAWRQNPHGRLAEVIVLDQFSRNMFRDTPLAFQSDSLALVLAQEAIAAGADKALNQTERSFLYMPFMHSESSVIHDIAVQLYKNNGNQSNLEFELKHQAIIEKFGRYPHRNEMLGRTSSKQEIEFLQQPGSSF